MQRLVHLITAQGEEFLAERLAGPLEEAGFSVRHNGTVMVGESLVGEPAKLLATGVPVVLCATVRAVGSEWAHRLVNAAHATTNGRVYVVQMDEQAYVRNLSLDTKVARYDQDPQRAVAELVEALSTHFPTSGMALGSRSATPPTEHFLDQPTTEVTFDPETFKRFQGQIRDEAKSSYPETLNAHEFLDKAKLVVGANLTRAGLLLFGVAPESVLPSAIIQCVRYHGENRTAPREIVRITGPLLHQISAAWQFVAGHTYLGETTADSSVQADAVYHYPMVAVRELIVNAVVHRQYADVERCVHVRLFSDRLEIVSAGEWMGRPVHDETTNELADLEGESRSRNFRLAHLLAAVKLFEGEGSGIPTAVADCRSCGAPEPQVFLRRDSVTVVLRPGSRAMARLKEARTTNTSTDLVPSQIPHAISKFVGRRAELKQLNDMLTAQNDGGDSMMAGLCIISGPPGVGKTALAVHWAHSVHHWFPDGQLYVDLRGFGPGTPYTSTEALRTLLASLGVRNERIPADLEAQGALFRSLLRGRRVLVVLDNAADGAQVRPLLPASHASMTVITSRHRLAGLVVSAGAHSLALHPFSAEDALALLGRHVGMHRIEAEPHAAAALVALSDGLPLAVSIVASRAATRPEMPLSDAATELTDRGHLLDAFDTGDDTANIRVVFSWSYQRLTPQAAQLFRRISLHPGPDLDAYATASLAGEELAPARALLDELARAHFLDSRKAGRFGMHDLLREYGRELAHAEDAPQEVELAVRRMLDYYVRAAVLADQRLDDSWEAIEPEPTAGDIRCPPLDGYEQAVQWLSTERPTLMALVRYAEEHSYGRHAWQIAWALTTYLFRLGAWHDWASVNEIALAATRQHGEPVHQARANRILGSAYARLNRYAEAAAHHQEALTLFQCLGDVDGQAHSHLLLGRCFAWQARYPDALLHAKQALSAYSETGNLAWVARSLTDVGRIHWHLGDHQQCIQLCEQALRLCQTTGDDDGRAAAMHTLGRALISIGRYRDATNHLEHASAIRRHLADHFGEAESLIDLGEARHIQHENAAAQDAWHRAFDILHALEHPAAEKVRARLAEVPAGRPSPGEA